MSVSSERNEVSDVIGDDKKGISIGGRNVIPALGLAWSHMVSTRIMLSRTEFTLSHLKGCYPEGKSRDHASASKVYDPVVRKLQVIFAPHIPNNECYFIVEEDGLRGIM